MGMTYHARDPPIPGRAGAVPARDGRLRPRVAVGAGPGLGRARDQAGHLHKPRVAAFDAKDHLFLADLTDRIQLFDRDGHYLGAGGRPISTWMAPAG